jgi:hypothetical protein
MREQDQRDGNRAERIDAGKAPEVKRAVHGPPFEPHSLKRHHQHEAGMNKEKQDAPRSEPEKKIVALSDAESSAEMVGKDGEHGNRAQEIEIGRLA